MTEYDDRATILVADIDCTSEVGKPLCDSQGVDGFPRQRAVCNLYKLFSEVSSLIICLFIRKYETYELIWFRMHSLKRPARNGTTGWMKCFKSEINNCFSNIPFLLLLRGCLVDYVMASSWRDVRRDRVTYHIEMFLVILVSIPRVKLPYMKCMWLIFCLETGLERK